MSEVGSRNAEVGKKAKVRRWGGEKVESKAEVGMWKSEKGKVHNSTKN